MVSKRNDKLSYFHHQGSRNAHFSPDDIENLDQAIKKHLREFLKLHILSSTQSVNILDWMTRIAWWKATDSGN